jgi:hypothetical protein
MPDLFTSTLVDLLAFSGSRVSRFGAVWWAELLGHNGASAAALGCAMPVVRQTVVDLLAVDLEKCG